MIASGHDPVRARAPRFQGLREIGGGVGRGPAANRAAFDVPRPRSLTPIRRRWGQHFLVRPEIAERIVGAARIGPEDVVLEIGPGEGALTRPIAARGARLVAVEIDPARAEALSRELQTSRRVTILRGDVLERSFGEWLAAAGCGGPAILVGNLPYNVATPIVSRAMEEPAAIARAVVTVQREVARRFVARPGDDAYGYLSVRTAAFASGRILFDLPPGAFRPAPRVVSSVLELSPGAPSASGVRRDRALGLASLGFRARRKTLANALASQGGRAGWERALEALGRGPKTRAEELSWKDYLALADLSSRETAETG